MAYKSKVLTVAEGGTGVATLTGVLTGNGTGAVTANAVTQNNVLVAGSSNAVSSIAPGSSGNVLQSNGTDWTSAASSGGSLGTYLTAVNNGGSNPADTQVLFMGAGNFNDYTTSAIRARMIIASAGTITAFYGAITVQGTLGSSENCTFAIRLNDTTDTNVTTTLQLTNANNPFSATGLSIVVAAGDFIHFKFTGPTWVTNPTNCTFSGSAIIT